MVDLWRLGISVFMFSVLVALTTIVEKMTESGETVAVVFIVGLAGFLICLVGSLLTTKRSQLSGATASRSK